MKTTALVLIVALTGLDPLSTTAVLSASQIRTSDPVYRTSCTIPNVIGLSHGEAIQRLRSADLQVSIETRPSRSPRGIVIDQHPRQCRDLSKSRRVVVVVSAGMADGATHDGEPAAEEPKRPRAGGGSSAGTVAAVAAAAAIVAILASRKNSKDTAETPPTTEPPPAPAPPRTVPRSAVVPELVGMSSDEAQRTLADAKLQMRTTNESEAAVAGSQVAAQIPAGGTPVVPGASVAVTFAAPPPAPQPTPVQTPAPVPVVAPATPAPRMQRTEPAARVPPARPAVTPVIPSQSIRGLIEGPQPIVPFEPSGVPIIEVEPEVQWFLILLLILLAIALVAALGWYYRVRATSRATRIAPPRSQAPAAPRFTLIPSLDAGEQRIVSGGRSRSLELSFTLDRGQQHIRCVRPLVRTGALS